MINTFIRYIKLQILTLVCFCSFKCKDKPVNLVLDYSYNSGWAYSYSIKIYSNGKAFLKKDDFRTDSLFIKDQVAIDRLYSILSKIKKKDLATKYEEDHLQDGSSFNFIGYTDDNKVLKHYVYGNKYPAILNELKGYVSNVSNAKGWNYLTDTTVVFYSMINFGYIPKIIKPGTKFLPPKS